MKKYLFRAFLIPTMALSSSAALTNENVEDAYLGGSDKFVSDGSVVSLEKLGFEMTPPVGWEVRRDHPTLSLVISEKEAEETKVEEGKVKFRRYITVAAVHKPSPIDENRSKGLAQELEEKYSKDALVKDFQILEVKLFDYRAKNDGILVYSGMTQNGFPMMQMHVLVGGQDRQFLLSYTDLAERFTAGGPEFDAAWNAMATSSVIGLPPGRYDDFITWGIAGGGALILLLLFSFMRRRSANRMFEGLDTEGDDDFSFEDHSETHFDQEPKVSAGADEVWDEDDFFDEGWNTQAPAKPRIRPRPPKVPGKSAAL